VSASEPVVRLPESKLVNYILSLDRASSAKAKMLNRRSEFLFVAV
jgi:hypothetical protein